jgi:hypothetical protein
MLEAGYAGTFDMEVVGPRIDAEGRVAAVRRAADNLGRILRSHGFLYRPVSYTPSRTKVDSDGKVRLILCQEDPGLHYWMDTQSFARGNVTYRNLMSEAQAVFRTEGFKISELTAALPADTARVTPEERLGQMRERFNGIRQRYCL